MHQFCFIFIAYMICIENFSYCYYIRSITEPNDQIRVYRKTKIPQRKEKLEMKQHQRPMARTKSQNGQRATNQINTIYFIAYQIVLDFRIILYSKDK